MPKRKRTPPSSLQDHLEKCEVDVSRALKLAKGFERQRMNKRLRDAHVTPEKRERLAREIDLLKSLDLHQTANAHLAASLLKVKTISDAENLPAELLAGPAKPDLPPDAKAAMHNVTSGLYNRENVKQAIDRSVATMCAALGVDPPDKARRAKRAKREEQEEQPAERIGAKEEGKEKGRRCLSDAQEELVGEVYDDDESDFNGFESDVDEPGPTVGMPDSEDEAAEESALSKYDHLLGSSSDEDDDEGGLDEDRFERFKGTEKVNLDDISVSGSDSPGSASDINTSESEDASPPPSSSLREPAKKKSSTKKSATAPLRDSTFLPSLMGGYISGSESASDIDVAPAKKRRGQRARQAIWEKKFGTGAKHLQGGTGGGGGRDSGWDMRRGAVDGEDGGPGSRGKPSWKKGKAGAAPQERGRGPNDRAVGPPSRPGMGANQVQTKRDDQGPLHPSWAARKSARSSEKTAAFTGQKVVFD